jgi:FKBP-type peptidyl-prolyl cis-trans isomerase
VRVAKSINRPLFQVLACCLALVGATGAREIPAVPGAGTDTKTFFAENAKKPGVVSLPSGLQYRILRAGSGRKPGPSDSVTVRYRGTLPDGSEVDRSNKSGAPVVLRMDELVPGWKEALLLMPHGTKWQVFIPPELARPRRGTRKRPLAGGQPVIYEIELLAISESDRPEVAMKALSRAEPGGSKESVTWVYWMHGSSASAWELRPRAQRIAFFEENARKDSVITLPSGLQYRVLRRGNGRTPGPGDRVTVHYRGTRLDGTEFDSSHRGEGPATFRLDEVIPGWQEALQHMEEGATWEIYVPPELSYRQPGPLGAEPVIFEVELLAVSPADTAQVGMAAVAPVEAAGAPAAPQAARQAAPAGAESKAVAAEAGVPGEDGGDAGVIRLPGGLDYRVIRMGTGVSPMVDDRITLRYRAALVGGLEAGGYAAEGRTSFRLDQAIPLWQAVFQRMQEGAQWELTVPSDLAYSKWGPGQGETVALDVELLAVSAPDAAGGTTAPDQQSGQARAADELPAGEPALTGVPGGLQYRVLEPGSGDTPTANDTITVRYRAALVDEGAPESVYTGEGQETFRLDGAIPPWQEAFAHMRVGARWELYLPSEFAYSKWGPLGGGTMRFEVELVALGEPAAPDLRAAGHENTDRRGR